MARPRGWLRAVLVVYLAAAALVGGWTTGWPRSFYDDFPWPGHRWVSLLGPYNEHLVRDFGGMNLALAVVFGVAAVTLDRRLAQTVVAGYLVFAVPHLVFHANHLAPFGTADAAAQLVILAVPVVLSLPLLPWSVGPAPASGLEHRPMATAEEDPMAQVELSAGTIDYQDTGGSGPVVVLLGGVAMDGSLWRQVVAELATDHRCVVPTLPLGSHRQPMHADADLSPRGIAHLEAELLDTLDLEEVTLVGCDSGLFQLAAAQHPQRIARLVICSCEAFDNFPPGLPGRVLSLAGRVPGGLNALVQPLRLAALRRLPVAFGWMAKRPIPRQVSDAWLAPLLTSRGVRRDLASYLRAAARDPEVMLAAAEGLGGFDRPALVVWAAEDRVMPPEHGRRLAELLPQGRLVEVADSYTLLPQDQPTELARTIRQFITATATPAGEKG